MIAAPLGTLPAGETTPDISANAGHRYLLIFETSRAMRARMEGVLKVVQSLLGTSMSGQLRSGDTLGLWTFNESLYTGRFPLQNWSLEGADAITGRVLTFVKAQAWEKQAHLEPVLFAIHGLVEKSDHITVILFSNGDEAVRGTPFDNRINEFYRLRQNEQQRGRMPFVTVLRAAHGRITDYSVTAAPLPVEMPVLPAEVRMSLAPEPKPPSQKASAVISTQLVVQSKEPIVPARLDSGSTSRTSAPSALKTAKVSVPPPPLPPEVQLTKPRSPAPQVAVPAPTVITPPPPVATPKEGSQPKAEISQSTPSNSVPVVAPAKPELPPVVAAPPTNTIGQTEPTPAAQAATPAPVASRPSATPALTDTNLVEGLADRAAPVESASALRNDQSKPLGPVAELPAQAFPLPPKDRSLGGEALFVSALVLGAAVFNVAWFLNRRARATPSISLISRSLKRQKKK